MPLLALSNLDHGTETNRGPCNGGPCRALGSSMNYLNDAVSQSKNKKLHYSSSTEYAVEFFIAIGFQEDGFSNMTPFLFRSYTEKSTNWISYYTFLQNDACQIIRQFRSWWLEEFVVAFPP